VEEEGFSESCGRNISPEYRDLQKDRKPNTLLHILGLSFADLKDGGTSVKQSPRVQSRSTGVPSNKFSWFWKYQLILAQYFW
jgi:hypothetical protein